MVVQSPSLRAVRKRLENVMKTAVLIGAALCCAAGGVLAEDWTGIRAGVGYGWAEVDIPSFAPTRPGTAEVTSVFAGYGRDLGRTVVGAELEWSGSDVRTQDLDFRVTEILRTKLRVGYDAGRVLPYAFLGVAAADLRLIEGSPYSRDGFGPSLGFGVEVLVTPSLSVGAEVAMDRLNTGNFEYRDNWSNRFELQTLSVRASWRF